jgi:hypothetical protein
MADAPAAPSIWFGEDDIDQLEAFDYHFKRRTEGNYSRSQEIKRAMETHRVVDELLADVGWEATSERERHALLRQALYDHFREE